ncbi:MAG: hypothetical protein ABIH23_13830 [bacterium]
MRTEGVRYEPDLVIVCFVLNDVRDEAFLERFRDSHKGKLKRIYLSVFEKLSDHFALPFFMNRLAKGLRFGNGLLTGAIKMEEIKAQSLVSNPDRAETEQAWERTIRSLDGIFQLCEEQDVKSLLVIFPYKFQLKNNEEMAAPQERLARYADNAQIPCLDLLPYFRDIIVETSADREHIYLDECHLSPSGSVFAAKAISDFICEKELLWE